MCSKVEKMSSVTGKSHIAAYFVPMGRAKGNEGLMTCPVDNKKVPVHVLDARPRSEVLTEWIGELGSCYKNWVLSLVFAGASLAALLWVHWAVAAAFAYAAGYKYSEYLIIHAWNIDWYKGKSVIQTN